MHVSTLIRRRAALVVVVAIAAACSDAPIAPPAAQGPAFDIQALQPAASRGGGPDGGPAYKKDGDETVATLTIDPNVSRTYAFGEHWIYFPARSICDPATSGYGPTLWDTPCTALTQPIKVTVTWSNAGGHACARFSPELRFVPADADASRRWVILSLHDHKRLNAASIYNVLYASNDLDGWVDESLSDPTLRAWLDPLHNSIVRRIKHFSGYWVTAGFDGIGGLSDASY